MAKKKKYYVVWHGRETGIFESWSECQRQIDGFAGAKYMSSESKIEAEKAFNENHEEYYGRRKKLIKELTPEEIRKYGQPILDSVVVDAACSSKTGLVEYKGIYLKTNEELFLKGPYEDGTNNIGEFLAIVHALAFLKKHNLDVPVYSDSLYAIGWVKDKEARTNHSISNRNQKLFELIRRAVTWLKENRYPNKVLKWQTKVWGENPADFGRK